MLSIILGILKKIKFEVIFPYLLIIIGFFYMTNLQNQTKNDLLQFTNAMQDTVRVSVDKYGDKVAQISQLRTENPKVFLNIKSNDADIIRLQEEVKKYKNQIKEGSSVTVFDSSTKIDTTLAVNYNKDGTVTANASDNKWYSIKNTIIPDGVSTTSLEVKNEYTVAVVEEKGQSVVKIKNKNPYSTEGEIRTYANLPKQDKKVSLGVGVGYDPILGTIKPELQIQYKLLNLW